MKKQKVFFSKTFADFNKSKLLIFLLLQLVAVFISAAITNSPVSAKASTPTLEVSTNSMSTSITPNLSSGVFNKSANNNITVKTDNFTGYTLSIKAKTSGTNATNLVNGSNVLTSISSAISEEDFSAAANTNYNGKWGYQPSKYNSSANSNFRPAPSTTGETLDVTSGPNSTVNSYTIAIGARASQTTAPGNYSNVFTITAVTNPVGYNINYYKNTTDTVTNFPSNVSSTTSSETVTISNNEPGRTGYAFKGWCKGTATTSNITTVDGEDYCSDTTYEIGGTWTLDQTTSNSLYLYAMWINKTYVATIYYNDNSVPTAGTTSVKSIQTQCTAAASESSCSPAIPPVVTGSYGTYNNAYAGLASDANTMSSSTSIVLTGDKTFYAVYRANVTNYYYDGSAYSSRTLYRNQTLSSTSAMGAPYLSDSPTGLSNYSEEHGPGSSILVGYSGSLGSTTTLKNCTFSQSLGVCVNPMAAARSSNTTLNTIYRFTQKFSMTGATGVSAIGAYSDMCHVSSTSATAGGTSCTVTTPSITVDTGYTSLGWGTQGHTNTGTAANTDITVSTHDGVLYANAKLSTYTVTFDPLGGTVDPQSITLPSGSSIDTLPIPTATDCGFYGWYTTAAGGEKVENGYTPTQNITLYAHWSYLKLLGYQSASYQTWTAPVTAPYYMEILGGDGGGVGLSGFDDNSIGAGGSTGVVSLNKNTTLYVALGGHGETARAGNATFRAGGWNGGGQGGKGIGNSDIYDGGGGGGATSVQTTLRGDGQLKNYDSYRDEVLLVAGGSGGARGTKLAGNTSGGYGGGESGGDGSDSDTVTGGTQTSGNAFGQGGDVTTTKTGNVITATNGLSGNGGGGGGWYGGNASNKTGRNSNAPGAGGSGHINTNYVSAGATISRVGLEHSNGSFTIAPRYDVSSIPTMQSVTASYLNTLMPNEGSGAILRDSRNDATYIISKIQGNYWMVQNLNIWGAVYAEDSNFDSGAVNLCETSNISTTETYCNISQNTFQGTWYNYVAATAKTVTGESTATATQDICPSGWHLPDSSQVASLLLANNDLFRPITSGVKYGSTMLNDRDYGEWWTNENDGDSTSSRISIKYSSLNDVLSKYGSGQKPYGLYIRCVKNGS